MARKTKPKYSVGTKIYHVTSRKWGVIEQVFESDFGDGTFYEWRYYVRHSGWTWSVPERCLTAK